ncbi:MAG: hypothetical protein V3U82_00220 [Robiginitomaculum sp.]
MSHAATQNSHLPPQGGGTGSGINVASAWRSLLRKIPLMALIFLPLAIVGWYFGSQIDRTYTASARLMVQISDDYVFTPAGGGNNNGGLTLTPDSIALNEIGIINNPELIDNVMANYITHQKLYPELYGKFKTAENRSNRLMANDYRAQMIKKFESNLSVSARPKSSIIEIQFTHADPDIAKETVSAILVEYKIARKDVFVNGVSDLIKERRENKEKQLLTVDRAIARFLKRNSIGDFTSERTGARKRTEDLRAAMNTLQGNIRQAEAALMSVENSLRNTPPTIDLQIDDRASQRIAQAELERKQLLAKYLPTSDPVKAKEREIVELRQLIASAGGKAVGGRRVGPNTVYQALQTQRNTFQAQADSYREKEAVLQAQLNAVAGKTARIASLDPQYQNLLREKKTVETSLSALNLREQNAAIDAAQANEQAENVKTINEPGFARKGRNMKKIVQYGSILGAAATALMIGLLSVFLDPKSYGAPTGIKRPKASRTRKTDKRKRKQKGPAIPEPVPGYATPYETPTGPVPYTPIPEPVTPQPAYAAAAAVGAAVTAPVAYPQAAQAYGAPAQAYEAYGQPVSAAQSFAYEEPMATAESLPYAPQNYETPAVHAPSLALAMPADGSPQPYDPAIHGGGTEYVTGPAGTQVLVRG